MPEDAAAAPSRLGGARLHVVTGKGGTGKTTVATALALALAGEGRRVLLCEVEGRQGVARLLEVDDLPPRETEVAEGAGGGQVVVLAVDPRSALLLYLETFYHLGRAGAALERVGAVDFITAVAPGLRDILLIGTVYDAARRRSGADARGSGGAASPEGAEAPWAYDAVVLDAPPTGRIGKFLGIGDELAVLAGGGPIAGQAASVAQLLHSPATAVHLVTLLEDLPVQETLEAAAELAAAQLPLGVVVANRVLPALPGPAPEPGEVAAALQGAGLDGALAGPLLGQAAARGAAAAGQRAHLGPLGALGRPLVQLPQAPGGVDLAGVYALADHLLAELA